MPLVDVVGQAPRGGALRPPQLNAGIGAWATTRAIASGGRTALVHDGVEITYRELLDRSTGVARQLSAQGIRSGDRVAYCGRNHPDFVYAMLGAHLLGAVFV